MKPGIFLLSILFLFLSKTPKAQSQFSGWLASFNTIKTGKKTSIHLDVQARSTDEFKHLQSAIVRPGFNYHLNNRIVLTVGYAFIPNKRFIGTIGDFVTEHRIWQQALFSHSWSAGILTHRLRLEERFIPVIKLAPSGIETDRHVVSGRIRYFIRHITPIVVNKNFTHGFFGAIQNEVFLNVIDKHKVNNKVFDQNRIYLALGYRLSSKADLEIGYMNQYVSGPERNFTNNHIIQAAAYLRL